MPGIWYGTKIKKETISTFLLHFASAQIICLHLYARSFYNPKRTRVCDFKGLCKTIIVMVARKKFSVSDSGERGVFPTATGAELETRRVRESMIML